jgi:hypothetical protein
MSSATGIYLTFHYCSMDEITELFLFTPEAKCEHTGEISDNHCNNHNACHNSCSFSGIPECCSDTVFYIAVDDDFVKADRTEIQVSVISFQALTGYDLAETFRNTLPSHLKEVYYPPGKAHGKQLACANRQLLL